MTPIWFLRIGGVLSLGIGVLGIAAPSFLGEMLWFDVTENIVHTTFGIGLLLAGSLPSLEPIHRKVVWFTAIVSLAVGIGGLLVRGINPPNFLGITNLEHPIDNALHLVFGTWAFLVAYWSKK
jgi:hypothetical protein